MRGSISLIAAVVLVGAMCVGIGCDDPTVQVGPPRCEPSTELEVERTLKDGFKALARHDDVAAAAHFQVVLKLAPSHPEAQLGARLASRSGGDTVRPLSAKASSRGSLIFGGAALPVDFEVNTERYRFEEFRALHDAARANGRVGERPPIQSWFKPRTTQDGAEIALDDRLTLESVIDLLVLHDSHSTTAREAVVEMDDSGHSTHFLIDWDGTIFQTLDLAWEGNHVKRAGIDRRSIAIDLVNPAEVGTRPPTPPGVDRETVGRPLGHFALIQGKDLQHWGYTEPQKTALVQLVRALVSRLPRVTARVPASEDGAILRSYVPGAETLTGVAGHLHLFQVAYDPGSGFDWEWFASAIR
jgi:N-acetyl-anhydromuramyl-L-alanine amidase AmpD